VTNLLKLLLVLGVAGAIVVFVAKASRKRATAPAWRPPVVETPFPEPEPRVAESESEGMTPPPEAPGVDVAVSSTGEALVSELAAPGAADALLEEEDECIEVQLGVATEEGMGPFPGAPAEDLAFHADGEPALSVLASPEAEAELLAAIEDILTETALDIAAEEGMTPAEPVAEDVPLDSQGQPLVSEFAAPDAQAESAALDAEAALLDALAESEAAEAEQSSTPEEAPLDTALRQDAPAAPETIPNLESALDEAEAQGRAADGPADDDNVLTRAFDELAASADAPPVAPLAAEPEVRADEHLLSSVEEALGDLEPAPIVPPPRRTAESYLDEGNVYFNVGQYGLAIERYGAAISMDADLTAAYYNRANAHTRAGEFEKALADYDRALELQPIDADALNNRGMLHLYRSNYANALADFNRALELDPTDTTVMVNRGLAQLHSGNAASALVDFRQAANLDSGDAAAQYGAAQAAASMGDKAEALRHVARALELDSGYAREAAADPRLSLLSGDEEFLRLLRQSGTRSGQG
jgi:tetratricopeptide (TPR) repeat protein